MRALMIMVMASCLAHAQEGSAPVSTSVDAPGPEIVSPTTPAAAPQVISPDTLAPKALAPKAKAKPQNIQTSKIIKEEAEAEFPLTPEGSQEYLKKINQELARIKDLRPEEYIRDIDQYRSSIDKYVEHKKRVCQGEFSTVVLGSDGPSTVTKRKKLAPEERKLCFREMKSLQVGMVNNMYIARKRYLDYIHELRLKELAEARDKVIKDLEESFTR